MSAQISDTISAGLRLTTGNLDSPVSTNQTLGNSFNRNSLVLDRAFLKLEPYEWLTLAGGRIANPWFSTDLVWDEDLNFDGVAARLTRDFRDYEGFLTLGAFPLEEFELPSEDKFLFGAQTGVAWERDSGARIKLGLAYYDYQNIVGQRNAFVPGTASGLLDFTQAQSRQKGNSLFDITNDGDPNTRLFGLVTDFNQLNFTASADFPVFDPIHVVISGDYVRNLAFDREEVRRRVGITNPNLDIEPEVEGYLARLQVGWPEIKKRNDWQFFVAYKYLERDAVLDAFTDSDFHLGGTNAEGYIIYGLAKNTWASLRWLSADEIEGSVPLDNGISIDLPLAIDVFQFDLNTRF